MTSSAFTLKGELEPTSDLIVMVTTPPKPAWILVLEEESSGDAVELVVRPDERVKKGAMHEWRGGACSWGDKKFNESWARRSCWMIGLRGWACSRGEFLP